MFNYYKCEIMVIVSVLFCKVVGGDIFIFIILFINMNWLKVLYMG